MLNAPCKNCDKRFEGCHSKCNKYLAYRTCNQLAHNKQKRENLQINVGTVLWRT